MAGRAGACACGPGPRDSRPSRPSGGGAARTGPTARRPPRPGCAPCGPGPPRPPRAGGRSLPPPSRGSSTGSRAGTAATPSCFSRPDKAMSFSGRPRDVGNASPPRRRAPAPRPAPRAPGRTAAPGARGVHDIIVGWRPPAPSGSRFTGYGLGQALRNRPIHGGCRARTRGGARLAWRRTTFLSCTRTGGVHDIIVGWRPPAPSDSRFTGYGLGQDPRNRPIHGAAGARTRWCPSCVATLNFLSCTRTGEPDRRPRFPSVCAVDGAGPGTAGWAVTGGRGATSRSRWSLARANSWGDDARPAAPVPP